MDKFFAVVWKINALLLLISGLAFFGATFYFSKSYIDAVTNTDAEEIKASDEEPVENSVDEPVLSLGEFEPMSNSDTVLMPLMSRVYVNEEYGDEVCNYLFVNGNNMHWLLSHNDDVILRTNDLIESKNGQEQSHGRLFQIIKRDTNHDDLLDSADLSTLVVVDKTGHQYRELLKNIDTFIDYQVVSQKLRLVYEYQGQIYLQYFNLPDFSHHPAIAAPHLYP